MDATTTSLTANELYTHFFAIAIIFGTASFLLKVQLKKIESNPNESTWIKIYHMLFNLFSEIIFSICGGFVCYKVCLFLLSKGMMNQDLMMAFVSTACFSGTVFLFFMMKLIEKYIGVSLTGKEIKSDFIEEDQKPLSAPEGEKKRLTTFKKAPTKYADD